MKKTYADSIRDNLLLQTISIRTERYHSGSIQTPNSTSNRGGTLALKKRQLEAEDIKRAISPRDFYASRLDRAKFKENEWIEGGICPFHADQKPGSFHVNLISGGYHCFACDERGGDIVAFMMATEGLSFPDALKTLSREWGLI